MDYSIFKVGKYYSPKNRDWKQLCVGMSSKGVPIIETARGNFLNVDAWKNTQEQLGEWHEVSAPYVPVERWIVFDGECINSYAFKTREKAEMFVNSGTKTGFRIVHMKEVES